MFRHFVFHKLNHTASQASAQTRRIQLFYVVALLVRSTATNERAGLSLAEINAVQKMAIS